MRANGKCNKTLMPPSTGLNTALCFPSEPNNFEVRKTELFFFILNQTFDFGTQKKHGGVVVLRIVFVKKALLDTVNPLYNDTVCPQII